MLINDPYLTDNTPYLFHQMAIEVQSFLDGNRVDLINMGIGDVAMPVAPVVAEAMRYATEEIKTVGGFRGYPPVEGYEFARLAIATYYREMGIPVDVGQIYVGGGAKDELSAWSRVFDRDVPAMVVTPAYPVYVDHSRAVGRRVDRMRGGIEEAERIHAPHIIYLCSPNNPTGETLSKEELQRWVNYARDTHSIILFDAAYAAFVYPYSIFHCHGADEVCIEVGTLSKSASFSGLRFGWSLVGKRVAEGLAATAYIKYKSTATNGVPYVIQRAGEAALGAEGIAYSKGLIDGYRKSARIIGSALQNMGLDCAVGPYIWVKVPHRMQKTIFCDCLEKAHVVVTDGRGFGLGGEGYIRLSVFGLGGRETEVIDRLKRVFA